MSAVVDNARVTDEPISNAHHMQDGLNALDAFSKLAADAEVLDAPAHDVEKVAAGAEDVLLTGDNNDDTLVTTSFDDTLAKTTFVEVLDVSTLVNDIDPEALLPHTSGPDKENTIVIDNYEPPVNVHYKSLSAEVHKKAIALTSTSSDNPVDLAESAQEDANHVAATAISGMTEDEFPPTIDGTESKTSPVDGDGTIADTLIASKDDGEPPIDASSYPEASIIDHIKLSINGVGITTDAEPSISPETPTHDPNIVAEDVVIPAVEAQGIPTMAVEPEQAFVGGECGPIEVEASHTTTEISLAGDEQAVADTITLSYIAPLADTALRGDSTPAEAEYAGADAPPSPKEPEVIGPEASDIDSGAREIAEETPAATEPESEPTLEPTTNTVNLEQVEETESVTEVTATEALAVMDDTPFAVEEPEGATDAEDKPATSAESEVDATLSAVMPSPAETETEPLVSIELGEIFVAANTEPEIPLESVVAAEPEPTAATESITAEPEPVTVPDTEPVAANDSDPVAIAEAEPADVMPEVHVAAKAEPAELDAESTVVETIPIDVEPPSPNASFGDPDVVSRLAVRELQTPLDEETPTPMFEESEAPEAVPLEESTVPVEEVVPVDAAVPTGEPAAVEEAVSTEKVECVEQSAVAPVIGSTVEETAVKAEPAEPEPQSTIVETVSIDVELPSSNASFTDPEVNSMLAEDVLQTPLAEEIATPVFNEPAMDATNEESEQEAVEESPVEETTLAEDVIATDVVNPSATGEPAPVEEPASVEEVPSVEEVALLEESSVDETVLAEDVISIDVVAPSATGEPAPVEEPSSFEEAPSVEEVALLEESPVEETILVEDVIPIDVADTKEPAPVEKPSSFEEAPSVEEVALLEESLVEETTLAEDVIPIDVVAPSAIGELAAVEEPAPVEEAPSVEEVALLEESPIDEAVLAEDVVPIDVTHTKEPASEVPTIIEEPAPVEVTLGKDVTLIESIAPIILTPETVTDEAEPTVNEATADLNELGTPVDGAFMPEEALPYVEAADAEDITAVEVASSAQEPAISMIEPLIAPEERPAEEAVVTSDDVYAPAELAVEKIPIPSDEAVAAPAEEHEPVAVNETPVPEEAFEDTPATAEEAASVVGDEVLPIVDVIPLVAETPSAADEPDVEATPTTGEPPVLEGEHVPAMEVLPEALEPVAVPEENIYETVVATLVEDNLDVKEPHASAKSKELESATVEEPLAPVEDHELVAVQQASATVEESVSVDDQTSPARDEMPLIAASLDVDEPALSSISSTEYPPTSEECLATTLQNPFAEEALARVVEVATMPEEATSEIRTTPVFETVSTTPADPTCEGASSVEESAIESDAFEQRVIIEELAPGASEASILQNISTESVHAAMDPIEEASSKATITEEFAPITTVESTVVEDEPLVSQVSIGEESADADAICFGVNKYIEGSESPNMLAETFSELQETVERSAAEDITEQQEITTLHTATDIERPKSPWAPSYSVTTQGPGVPVQGPASTDESEDNTVPTHAPPEILVDFEADAIIPDITANVEMPAQSPADSATAIQSAEEEVALGEVEEAPPKSPWTPSYSVTVQGNVVQTNEGLDDLEQLTSSAAQSAEVGGIEEQPVSFAQEVVTTGEVSRSTTDTYAPLLEMLDETVEPDVPDSAVETDVLHVVSEQSDIVQQTESPVITPPEPPAEEELEEAIEIEHGSFIVEDESTQLNAGAVGERSQSPWTPSYSVTGLEPALEDQAVAEEGEFVEHGSFIMETQSPVVIEDIPEAKPDSALLTPAEDPVGDRPKSPWTPSYSVTKQGPNDVDEEMEGLDELEQLPGPIASMPPLAEPIPRVLITETRASVDEPDVLVSELSEIHKDVEETPLIFPILEKSQTIAKKPSSSAIDATNAAGVTDSTTLRIDIPTTNGDSRKRLESTTSSRFFPGGWFSSSPKVPEEGRASLDFAAGEFVHQHSVENTPTTSVPSAVEEDKEKKSRWCTIM